MRDTGYARAALCFCLGLTLLRIAGLFATHVTLYADEAQYWLWGKELAFGYYSKPPMIGWLIRAATETCGDTPACVRLPAPILHGLAALLIFAIGRRMFSARAGFWASAVYATLPGISLSSFIISTDAPLLFCWALALYFLLHAREQGGTWRWAMLGIALGLGLLSKYTMGMFVPGALLAAWRHPYWRPLLRQRGFWGALAIALGIFSPNIFWNMSHGWVSALHTRDNAMVDNWAGDGSERFERNADAPLTLKHCIPFQPDYITPTRLGERLEFFGAQFGVFGPILLVALLLYLVGGRREWRLNPYTSLLVWLMAPMALMVCSVSLLARAHANWGAPVYVGATLLAVHYLLKHPRWLAATFALQLAVIAFLYGYAPLGGPAGGKYDPFRRMRGWEAITDAMREQMGEHPQALILTDERKLAAMLTYLLRNGEGEPAPVFKWDEDARVSDYYEMTQDLQTRVGQDFLLVSAAPSHRACAIASRFEAARELQRVPLLNPYGSYQYYAIDLMQHFKGYAP